MPCTQCNDPLCSANRQKNQSIELQFRYTDKKHDIDLKIGITTSPTITIGNIIQDLIKLLYLDDIPPEEIRFVQYDYNNRTYQWDGKNRNITLQELRIVDGCTLCFTPTINAAPPKLCHLILVGPDKTKKIDYPWYRAKTTVAMLFEYILEKFSLKSIDRHRIHLFTVFDELDLQYDGNKRLSELNVYDQKEIYIQITPSLASKDIKENTNICVQSTYHKLKLNVSNTITIDELRNTIEKRLEGRPILDFKLYNEVEEEIDLSDSSRVLQSFGIKPNHTIFASFRISTGKSESPTMKTSKKSSNTQIENDKVTVIYDLPSNNPITIRISVRATIHQLIQEIQTRAHNQELVISEIYSDQRRLDFVGDMSRCLADLGVTPTNKIRITLTEKSPAHSSVVIKRSSSSSTPDMVSKSYRTNKKPIGLKNLGNTCYMNSALQCLAHLPPLTNFFLQGIDHAHISDDEQTDNDWNPYDLVGDITGAYAELLWDLWRCDSNDDTGKYVKPQRIRESIGEKDARFATKDQQDTQEFMTFFLDILHKELKAKNKNDRNTIIKQLFFGDMISTITCTACNEDESIAQAFSLLSIPLNRQERTFSITFISRHGRSKTFNINVPINGQVGHAVEIFADNVRDPSLYNYILVMYLDQKLDYRTPLSGIVSDQLLFVEEQERHEYTLPAPLRTPERTSTLINCLDDFFSREKLEDERTCPKSRCKKKTIATKQLKLQSLPPILVIQFKRFSHENGVHRKIDTFVDYPIDGLNLEKFLLPSASSSSNEAIYDLIAVINHTGSMSGGHYIAFARHCTSNKNDWYEFDDSYVQRVTGAYPDDKIISKHAYLLFYIKRSILN